MIIIILRRKWIINDNNEKLGQTFTIKNAYIVTWGKTESWTIFSITGILENGVDLKG